MKNKLAVHITVDKKIFDIRGHKVMLDMHLAELYSVKLKALIQSMKRNKERFPGDFMFQLTKQEYGYLRSQFVTLEMGRGKHRKYLPYVFTQDGVAMLSSILNSKRAISVNIQIIRAFNRMRETLNSYKHLQNKISEMEKKYDKHFAVVFQAIQSLLETPKKPVRIRGFQR